MNARNFIIGIVLGILVTVTLGARRIAPFTGDQILPITTVSGELVLVDIVSGRARFVKMEDSGYIVKPR